MNRVEIIDESCLLESVSGHFCVISESFISHFKLDIIFGSFLSHFKLDIIFGSFLGHLLVISN